MGLGWGGNTYYVQSESTFYYLNRLPFRGNSYVISLSPLTWLRETRNLNYLHSVIHFGVILEMDEFSASIRPSALGKLATLAVRSPESDEKSDIARISRQFQLSTSYPHDLNGVLRNQAPTSRVPMGIRELDVLIALCKASPSVDKSEHASRLVAQLSRYLPEAHSQLFRPSPFLHHIKPSPWEALTNNVTLALLSLGSESRYPLLRETVLDAVEKYLEHCAKSVQAATPFTHHDSGTDYPVTAYEAVSILSITVSLVGFLEASTKFASFWTAIEKLRIIEKMRSILSEGFKVADRKSVV